jgi:hypothetical protein
MKNGTSLPYNYTDLIPLKSYAKRVATLGEKI